MHNTTGARPPFPPARHWIPETYIVRVYRRSITPAVQLVGTVETPGGSRSAAFTNLTELATILDAPGEHLREPAASHAADSFSIRLYRQDRRADQV